MIDWDLEAPGLHRYFEPFLEDKTLQRSTGVIDFVLDFATAAVSGDAAKDPLWYEPYSNVLAHALSIEWDFANGGLIDFVPAGRQDAGYAARVNAFNWGAFYEKLGGGVLLETMKLKLRSLYDFVLIDSRTGVSDTSGVCTVQMPDELVVCFTLNRQSVYGAAAAARSAQQQRRVGARPSTLKVWPVPTRVEASEKDRLEIAETIARAVFTGLLAHLEPLSRDDYWGTVGVPYEPYYAYEEVLAIFRDRPRQTNSMLSKMEYIAQCLLDDVRLRVPALDEDRRQQGLAAFTSRSALQYADEQGLLAGEYEDIRGRMQAGPERTEQMSLLVGRAQILGAQQDAGSLADRLFTQNTDGFRIVGLALARKDPLRNHLTMALDAITHPRSPFEQFHALMLLQQLIPLIDATAKLTVRGAIAAQMGTTITQSDLSRWRPATSMVNALESSADTAWTRPTEKRSVWFASHRIELEFMECRPSTSIAKYSDPDEHHGEWVHTRGTHHFTLPASFAMSKYLVTNSLYLQFVADGGYEDNSLWTVSAPSRARLVTGDGRSLGPASWPSATILREGHAHHPVSGISYYEAQAFVEWCNRVATETEGQVISLPDENLWEFAARGESGLTYPWGDAFDIDKCNCAEQKIGGTSRVDQFASGASPFGCCDMAGNVWEFVHASDIGSDRCAMRGGSYLNTRSEVRAYLRLLGVPRWHRAPDFGARLMLIAPPAR